MTSTVIGTFYQKQDKEKNIMSLFGFLVQDNEGEFYAIFRLENKSYHVPIQYALEIMGKKDFTQLYPFKKTRAIKKALQKIRRTNPELAKKITNFNR